MTNPDAPVLPPETATPHKSGRRQGTTIERAGILLTQPPRRRSTDRSGLVALVHDGRDTGVLDLLQTGIANALTGGEHALVLQVMEAEVPGSAFTTFLTRHRQAGVMLAPALAHRIDLIAACRDAQVPSLLIHPAQFGCDERQGAADAVRWLIAKGHARIGMVAGPEGSESAGQRELGYLDAIAEHGLDRGPALIVPGDNSFASGIEAGRLLLEISPRPTAILAANDEMAAGLLHAATHARVAVPGELSVVGFDDTALGLRTLPTLATVHIPWQAITAEAVRRILSNSDIAPNPTTFAPRLVVRESVAPAP